MKKKKIPALRCRTCEQVHEDEGDCGGGCQMSEQEIESEMQARAGVKRSQRIRRGREREREGGRREKDEKKR